MKRSIQFLSFVLCISLIVLSFSSCGIVINHQLTAEDIAKKCSKAVFCIEVFDECGDLIASGSGFFISKNGLAVTNCHVFKGGSSAEIILQPDNQRFSVDKVYKDEANDWAIFTTSGYQGSYLRIGDVSGLEDGATIFTIGSPLGLQNTISEGIISSKKRNVDGIDYIQISAPISSGSSGGALINKYGEVVGITAASFVEGQNLNLAIPIDCVSIRNNPTQTLRDYAANDIAKDVYGYLTKFIEKHGENDGEVFELSSLAITIKESFDSKISLGRVLNSETGVTELVAMEHKKLSNGEEERIYITFVSTSKIDITMNYKKTNKLSDIYFAECSIRPNNYSKPISFNIEVSEKYTRQMIELLNEHASKSIVINLAIK